MSCSSCHLRSLCLPATLNDQELEYAGQRLLWTRRKVPRGSRLFHTGDRFETLYAVWTGHFKTAMSTKSGREQVTGFLMAGELIGLDGIAEGRHAVDAIALDDSQVCALRFDELEALMRELPALQQRFHRLVSRGAVHHQGAMLQLGSMYAEERLASFLLDLSSRLKCRGLSSTTVTLHMTREDIGSYLGLSLETVSRTLTRMRSQGILRVKYREILLVDPEALQRRLDGEPCEAQPSAPAVLVDVPIVKPAAMKPRPTPSQRFQ